MSSNVKTLYEVEPRGYSPAGDAADPVERSRLCEVVLTASYPMLLEGLQRKFESEPGFHVISCCTNGAQALGAVLAHQPDVLVLDLEIAGKTAFEVLQDIRARQLDTRVVLLADEVGEDELLEATRLGVKGIVLKAMSSDLLVLCVRKVHSGATWFERVSMGRAFARLLRHRNGEEQADGRLTRRQLEIMRLVVRGHSNKEIAGRLTIREGTVKAHLHRLYERLGVRGRVELVLYSQKQDI